MTLFDLALLAIVACGAWLGWRKGLTGQIASVLGVVAAVIVCRAFGAQLAEHFTAPGDSAQTRMLHTVLAYAALACGTYLLVRWLAAMLRQLLRSFHLGIIDRGAGAVFAAFEWLMGLSLALGLWMSVFTDSEVRSSNGAVAAFVIDLAPTVLDSDWARGILHSSKSETSRMLNTFAPDSVKTL